MSHVNSKVTVFGSSVSTFSKSANAFFFFFKSSLLLLLLWDVSSTMMRVTVWTWLGGCEPTHLGFVLSEIIEGEILHQSQSCIRGDFVALPG